MHAGRCQFDVPTNRKSVSFRFVFLFFCAYVRTGRLEESQIDAATAIGHVVCYPCSDSSGPSQSDVFESVTSSTVYITHTTVPSSGVANKPYSHLPNKEKKLRLFYLIFTKPKACEKSDILSHVTCHGRVSTNHVTCCRRG